MKLLTAGCSFSACSSLIEEANADPASWPHHLINRFKIDRFANMAIAGGGNIALVNNLIYFLETKPDWNPESTLVAFNITELFRYDIMVPIEHPDRAETFSWDKDLGYNWLLLGPFNNTFKPPFRGQIQKNMGYEQVIRLNCLELVKLFCYLEHRKFPYFYMLIDNNVLSDSPEWFCQVLEKHKNRLALSMGMSEFAKKNTAVEVDDWHPNKHGHKLLAQELIAFIDQQGLTKDIY